MSIQRNVTVYNIIEVYKRIELRYIKIGEKYKSVNVPALSCVVCDKGNSLRKVIGLFRKTTHC